MKTVKILNPYALQILEYDSSEKEAIKECAEKALQWAVNQIEKDRFNVNYMTVETFKKYFGIHFSDQMTGKMEDMIGISTAVTENEHCRKMAENPLFICHECYAAEYLKVKKEPEKAYTRNGRILQNVVIPEKYWPYIFADLFRIESFGDCANTVQATNYFFLCWKNFHTGRASTAYLRAFLTVKPYMVGRKLHNGGGSHDDALARVNEYITGKAGI